MTFKTYSKTLPLAKKIYESIAGLPDSHVEWADSFNKIGTINNLIINYKSEIWTQQE